MSKLEFLLSTHSSRTRDLLSTVIFWVNWREKKVLLVFLKQYHDIWYFLLGMTHKFIIRFDQSADLIKLFECDSCKKSLFLWILLKICTYSFSQCCLKMKRKLTNKVVMPGNLNPITRSIWVLQKHVLNILVHICSTVRPWDTRPQAARTSQMHVFELGRKKIWDEQIYVEQHGFLIILPREPSKNSLSCLTLLSNKSCLNFELHEFFLSQKNVQFKA